MTNLLEISKKIRDAATMLGELVAKKNEAYGNSVDVSADIMKLFYPHGIPLSAYRNASLMIRTIDKMNRVAEDNDAFGENPWLDIAGYGLRGSLDPVSSDD